MSKKGGVEHNVFANTTLEDFAVPSAFKFGKINQTNAADIAKAAEAGYDNDAWTLLYSKTPGLVDPLAKDIPVKKKK